MAEQRDGGQSGSSGSSDSDTTEGEATDVKEEKKE